MSFNVEKEVLRIRVALVTPTTLGGVETVTIKLFRGLLLEGFDAKLVQLHDINLVATLFSDLLNTKNLEKFHAVIFMGSMPWPSHLLTKKPITALFLHGFVHSELLNAIMHGTLRVSLGAMSLLSYWKLAKSLNRIDFFICHSVTTCEKNGVHTNCILLPQFVLPEEVELYSSLAKGRHKYASQKKRIKVLTYGSFVDSPRLLRDVHIISLMREVSKLVNKNIELVIVDPKGTGKSFKQVGNLMIRRVCYMPKDRFLKFLANSDLYIEKCIDEELRYGALEAGLLGTPIVKITHPCYVARQDYTEDHILLAKSYKGLVYKLAEHIKHMENSEPYYSEKMKEFITKYRTWNAVKDHLIKHLVTEES